MCRVEVNSMLERSMVNKKMNRKGCLWCMLRWVIGGDFRYRVFIKG